MKNVKDEFLNDGVDPQVLDELKQVPYAVMCLVSCPDLGSSPSQNGLIQKLVLPACIPGGPNETAGFVVNL